MTKTTRPSRDALVELIPNLRRFACALVGNRDDGDDLVQSTLEKLMSKGVPEGANLKPWAFRICRNLRIDAIRSAEVKTRLDPKYVGYEPLHEDGERTMVNKLMFKDVTAAMEDLPVDQRAALALRYDQDMPQRDAAEILGTSEKAYESLLIRGRKRLKEMMQERDYV